MKKIAVVLLLFFCASQLRAQEKTLYLYEKDGTVQSYSIDGITKMLFTSDSFVPPNYTMKIMSGGNPIFSFGTSGIDSIITIIDSTPDYYLKIFSRAIPPQTYSLGRIDSISFLSTQTTPANLNENVNMLPSTYIDNRYLDTQYGNFHSSVWVGDTILSAAPLCRFDLSDSLFMVSDSLLNAVRPLFIRYDENKSRLLTVASKYTDVSIGPLIEFTRDSANPRILDADTFISSAAYLLPGSDSVVFYTYGSYSDTNQMPSDAGYYMLDLATGYRSMLLHYISDLGPGEMVNGFDISPDGSKLLIPSEHSNTTPTVFEYDLKTHQSDTLPIKFNFLMIAVLYG